MEWLLGETFRGRRKQGPTYHGAIVAMTWAKVKPQGEKRTVG
jgi:hypothetical protein